ncbi:hypothetical protein ACIPL1_30365 [Pseudomonas sp. NPDC090202]|uniref:hypothetical protein n=1 Tax=unclassified Pseudomonas TaxID=196821 RepID=UPI00382E40BD
MPDMMANAGRTWLMWGIFDALYVVRYIIYSVLHSRVPYIEDFRNSMEILAGRDIGTQVLASFSWALDLSMIISSILFLGKWHIARWLAGLQIPLRLLLFVPSVSILFMGGNPAVRYGTALMLVLLVVSECLKGWTLWATRKSPCLR